jgi:protein involved in polysaccharide export with SLBB domain
MKTAVLKLSRGTFVAAVGTLLATSSLRGGDVPQNAADAEFKTPQFVYIGGEVKIPQRCVYTNGMTLATAIQMAGGVTDFGSQTQVKLTRGPKKPLVLDLRKIEEGKQKDIKLEPDDKVFVPRRT